MISGESFDDDKSELSDSSSGASADQQENGSYKVHQNGSSDNVTDQDLEDILDEKEYREDKLDIEFFTNKIAPNKKKLMKQVFELYQRELDKRNKKIIENEKEISAKNKRILELEGKVTSLEERVLSGTLLNQKAVRRSSEPDLLVAREEVIQNLCDKYGQAMADLQSLRSDYSALQQAVLQSGQDQEANILTAQESITAAVTAKVRCAELEEENSELITQLIDLKTKYAVEMENETAKNNSLLIKIDSYAEKLALMEKKYIQALAYALPQGSNSADNFSKSTKNGEGSHSHNQDSHGVNHDSSSSSMSTGECINVDDIYDCRSLDESSQEMVSPIFARSSSRLNISIGVPSTDSISFPSQSPSVTVSAHNGHMSPFASHIAETAGPQVNPLSSKNWLWK